MDEAQTDANVLQSLLALLSARQVQRVGTRAAVRRLPSEMIRMVAQMARIEARDGNDEEESSSGSDNGEHEYISTSDSVDEDSIEEDGVEGDDNVEKRSE